MAAALLLALVGVYAVISYQAAQRTREFGLRLAFGASRCQIHRFVLRQALRIAGWGTLFGLGATLNLAFVVRHLVYGIDRLDVVALALAVVLVVVATLVAGSVPAWRAGRVDPMNALRYE